MRANCESRGASADEVAGRKGCERDPDRQQVELIFLSISLAETASCVNRDALNNSERVCSTFSRAANTHFAEQVGHLGPLGVLRW